MAYKRRYERIMTSSSTLPVVLLISIAAWIVNAVVNPQIPSLNDDFFLFGNFDVTKFPIGWSYVCSIALYTIVGYLLVELNNRSDILRVRSSVLLAVFFIFITLCTELYAFSFINLSLIFFLLSIFFLFNSYQCRSTSVELYYSYVFLALGSIFFPQMLYLVPIWFIGSIMLQSLHLRSFWGAIVGFCLPYIGLLTYALIIDNVDVFYAPFNEIFHFGGMNIFEEVSLPNLLSFSFLFLLFVISAFHCIVIDYDNKIKTRIVLHFIIFLNSCLFIFAILQPIYELPLLALAIPLTSLMIAHLFIRSSKNITYYLFIASIVFLLLCYLYKAILYKVIFVS
jgi:hypothetical protein